MLNLFATFARQKKGPRTDGSEMMKRAFAWTGPALLLGALGIGFWLLSPASFAKDPTPHGFPTLRSESVGKDEHGNTVVWRIYSAVEPVAQEGSERQAIPLFVSQAGVKGQQARELLRYRYVFENDGTSTIRINLSDWDVVHSPLTEVLQGFALELGAQESATVEFLTDKSIAPQNLLSPVNIAVWNPVENRWSVLGAGQASLYAPSALGLLKAPPRD